MTESTEGLYFRDIPQIRPPYIEPHSIEVVCDQINEYGVEPFVLMAEAEIFDENPLLFTSPVEWYQDNDDERMAAVYGVLLGYYLLNTQRKLDALPPFPRVRLATQAQFDEDIRNHGIDWVMQPATHEVGVYNPGLLIGVPQIFAKALPIGIDDDAALLAAVCTHELLRHEMLDRQA